MRCFLVIFLFIVLTSCTTSHKVITNPAILKSHLNKYEGLPIYSIFNRFGNPTELYRTKKGDNYYIYITQYNENYPFSNGRSLSSENPMIPKTINKYNMCSFQVRYSSQKCALLFKTTSQFIIIATAMTGSHCASTIAFLDK